MSGVSALTQFLLTAGSTFRVCVVSDVGVPGELAVERALPCGTAFAPRRLRQTGGPSPLLEKPGIYNGLYLSGRRQMHS